MIFIFSNPFISPTLTAPTKTTEKTNNCRTIDIKMPCCAFEHTQRVSENRKAILRVTTFHLQQTALLLESRLYGKVCYTKKVKKETFG